MCARAAGGAGETLEGFRVFVAQRVCCTALACDIVARAAKHAGGCALLLRRGRRRPLWALGRVCTTQPGVSCGVCHKCRASAEARRRSGCVGGIARGIEALRVHGVGRRGGSRGAVSLCAPHSPAQAVAHSFVRSGSHGAAGAGCEGEGGSRTTLRRRRSPRLRIAVCVCVIAGLRPRGSERAHRGSGCALG